MQLRNLVAANGSGADTANDSPYRFSPNYFKRVRISAVALIKMVRAEPFPSPMMRFFAP